MRRIAYVIIILSALVISSIPAILWMDFVAPYSAYDAWQRRENELVFPLSKTAAAGDLDGEIALFKVLVAPTLVPTLIGISRPEYTRFAYPDGVVVELAGVQPSRLAIHFIAVAVPTWIVLLAIFYELARWAYRRRRAT